MMWVGKPRHASAAWPWVLAAALAACGGGGGGSDPAPPQVSNVSWLQNSVVFERDVFDTGAQPPVTASLSIRAPGVRYWYAYTYNQNLYALGISFRTQDDGLDFSVQPFGSQARAAGVYNDSLTVRLCYDQACTREVQGSPFSLPIQLRVGYFAAPETGVPLLAPKQTTLLNHDVVAAAYSHALDAVVMVSARPDPVLLVHDLRSGATRRVALLSAPTSLSLGADGLQAAVGHDAAVSLVDLRAGASNPVQRMAVPLPVGAVLLAGTRVVAMGAQVFNSNEVYWLDTSTGLASRAGNFLFPGVGEPVLHPDGDRLYSADSSRYPDDVWRLDLNVGAAVAQVVDSRYHGQYPFCSRLALSPDGRRLYTGCGVVLSVSPLVANDMLYAGQLALSTPAPSSTQRFRATSLAVAPNNAQLALLEEDGYACDARLPFLSDCHTHLAVYDTTTLARLSLRGMPVLERGADRIRQWGRRVMVRADGSLLLLAEARTQGEATPTWLLHRVAP